MFSVESWKNITMDEIYHPKIQLCYRIFFTFLFGVMTAIFPLIIYIILTQSSKEMGNYKYFLVFQLVAAYLFHGIIVLIEPVYIFPIPLSYPNGFIDCGENYAYFFAAALVILVAGCHGIVISFAYRIGATFLDGPVTVYFNSKKLMVITNALIIAIFGAMLAVPVLNASYPLPVVHEAFIADAPALKELFRLHPTATGFHPKLINKWLDVLIISAIIEITILPIEIFIMHVLFRYRMKKLAKILSIGTLKVHHMLYRALTVQLLVCSIFLFIPLCIFIFVFIFQLKNGSILTSLAIDIGGCEVIANALSMMYFIKPYRVYILKKVSRKTIPVILSTPPGSSQVTSTTGNYSNFIA